MFAAGHAYELLSPAELEIIHRQALLVLAQMGMQIENRQLLEALGDFGLTVDMDSERVRFPTAFVEEYLEKAVKYEWETATPTVGGSAGVYHGRYHDPLSNELVPWTQDRLVFYFRLARELSHIDGAKMLGCRLPVPAQLEPLYERYYCLKYGAGDSGTIFLDALCPYLLEYYQAVAEAQKQPMNQVFRGTVYLVPPLKLGRNEANQVAYFWERGLRVRIGDMYAMGATAPVTIAGAVTLNLAEHIALCILNWVLFSDMRLRLGGSISVMDMRTTIYPYGRPEMALANLMTAQLARHYGAAYSGHAGLSDAKLPSVEAGAQKALTAIPTLLACGGLWMDAGLLSIDEVCSPIQLVLDNEFLSCLSRFACEFEISEERIGLDTILNAGPGGHYLDKMHTVKHLRSEHWQPEIWSRQMLQPWLDSDHSLDVDRARDRVLAIQQAAQEPASFLSSSLEHEILSIIDHARRGLVDA